MIYKGHTLYNVMFSMKYAWFSIKKNILQYMEFK